MSAPAGNQIPRQPVTRVAQVAHHVGLTCAALLFLGLALLVILGTGFYLGLLVRLFWHGWRLAWWCC